MNGMPDHVAHCFGRVLCAAGALLLLSLCLGLSTMYGGSPGTGPRYGASDSAAAALLQPPERGKAAAAREPAAAAPAAPAAVAAADAAADAPADAPAASAEVAAADAAADAAAAPAPAGGTFAAAAAEECDDDNDEDEHAGSTTDDDQLQQQRRRRRQARPCRSSSRVGPSAVRAERAPAPNSAAPAPDSAALAPGLPMWRRHYLLADAEAELEACSASRAPRAWRAARRAAQGELQLPGTAAMQALIWEHQHPADCSVARFLVYESPGHAGLGALVDNLADALAWAMTEDRVLLMDYPSHWTRGEHSGKRPSYCHGGALAFDECFLEPLSSCSLSDVYSPDVVAAWAERRDEAALHDMRKQLHGERLLFNSVIGKYEHGRVPPKAAPFMGSILQGVKIGGVMSELFWWRAQGVAYLFRLNARTQQVLAELKHRFFEGQTVPRGAVSVHVRRGNKVQRQGGGEMGYVDDDTFIRYAAALQAGNADVLQRTVFVSTEDPVALAAFEANMTGWTVLATTVPRDNHQGQAPFAREPTVEALRAFLNLDLALECDGWVGTLGSMWTTLTERLRSTVRCKADRPYTDAHGTLAGLGSV